MSRPIYTVQHTCDDRQPRFAASRKALNEVSHEAAAGDTRSGDARKEGEEEEEDDAAADDVDADALSLMSTSTSYTYVSIE